MKVIEIGCVPPPYGGVAVHLQRLLPHLRRHRLPHQLFDISGILKTEENVVCRSWRGTVLQLLSFPRAIVHFHNFTPRNLPVYSILGLKHLTILTLHNERFSKELNCRPAPIRRLLAFMLNRLDAIIVPNDQCRRMLAPLLRTSGKLTVCPEFIAPATLPDTVLPDQIVALRKRHQYLISANAFQISFHQGVDLYGIDLLVELVARLIHDQELDVALVFLLPSTGDRQYFTRLTKRIAELGIADFFVFITKPLADACAVWRISDLVIRATNTDGNSLTVKEALWCGTPVVASDCVPRDPEVILFRTRDLADLQAKVVDILMDSAAFKNRLRNSPQVDHAEKLINIYRRLMERG